MLTEIPTYFRGRRAYRVNEAAALYGLSRQTLYRLMNLGGGEPKPAKNDEKAAARHNQAGRELLKQGKNREAVEELSAALEAKSDFALALNAYRLDNDVFPTTDQGLSALRTLDRQIVFEDQAVKSAALAAKLADSLYRNGSTSYFESIDAQRSSLAAQRAMSRSLGQRAVASVGLIRALGGGWSNHQT